MSTPDGNTGADVASASLAACLTETSLSSNNTESQSNSSSDFWVATSGKAFNAETLTEGRSSSRANKSDLWAAIALGPLSRVSPSIPSSRCKLYCFDRHEIW